MQLLKIKLTLILFLTRKLGFQVSEQFYYSGLCVYLAVTLCIFDKRCSDILKCLLLVTYQIGTQRMPLSQLSSMALGTASSTSIWLGNCSTFDQQTEVRPGMFSLPWMKRQCRSLTSPILPSQPPPQSMHQTTQPRCITGPKANWSEQR